MKFPFVGFFVFVILVLFGACNLSFGVSFESIAITIDMCPSKKPYDKGLFTYLSTLSKKLKHPVPIGVALSGGWIIGHSKELAQIKKQNLNITWINHSYSHRFFNNPKLDLSEEIGENLKLFRQNDLKVSKYFRFPGLIATQLRIKQLRNLGYTPLGSNAWLAKGQKIKDNSIVLVHGNGNELYGAHLLVDYLRHHEKEILAGKIQLLSLSQTSIKKSW